MTMTTMGDKLRMDKGRYGRAWVLATCVLTGLGFLALGLSKDLPALGYGGLAIMLGYWVVLTLTRRRSETMSLLAGDVSDERQGRIMTRAMAFTGNVWMVVILGGFLYGVATDSPHTDVFSSLAAVGGLTFATSLFVLSRRG